MNGKALNLSLSLSLSPPNFQISIPLLSLEILSTTMSANRRQDFAARNSLTFTAAPRKPIADPARSDEEDFVAWAEGIKLNSGGRKSGAWKARRSSLSSNNEEFRWLVKDGDDSEAPSPRMWDQAGPGPDPVRSAKSSTPRAQQIARYRQEMMDLVRDAPESEYELSLRDLVVQTPKGGNEFPAKEGTELQQQLVGKREKREAPGVLLLRIFFPFLGMAKGRRRATTRSNRRGSGGGSAKISPRPSFADRRPSFAGRSSDGEWWNKSDGGDTSSSSSSANSNSSSISSISISCRSTRELRGCYSFFHANRNQTRGL